MAKKVVNVEAGTVTFDFTKDGGESIVASIASLPAAIVQRLALHGLSQKVGDSYANAAKQSNPLEWAMGEAKAVIESLTKGVFNAGRTGDGAARVSILARALHAIKVAAGDSESTEAAAQAYLDELEKLEDGKAQIAALKSKKKVARMLDQIRLADAKAKLERAAARAAAGEAADDEDDDEE